MTTSTKDKKDDHDHGWARRAATNFDTLGAWNGRMELPVDMAQSIKSGKLVPEVSLEPVGTATMQGRRQVNEDRFHIAELSDEILMFAMFDGHGGEQAVNFTSSKMEAVIRYRLQGGEKSLSKILKESFLEINAAYAHVVKHLGAEGKPNSGTTATVCLLRNNIEMVVGFVGDSKALMSREGKVVRLSMDHKPENPVEKDRIKAAGGHVTWTSMGSPRVNGRLNMTRSIGDLELKSVGVIAEPEIRSIEVRHSRDSFLVLTTDGISNVISDKEVVDIVNTHSTPAEAALFLADQALHFGSEDNVTALVVPFGAWGRYVPSSRVVPFRSVIGSRYS